MDPLTRSDWTAAGSLIIAAIALWRSLVAPVRSLQTSVLRDAAELRVEIDSLEPKIAMGIQSRQRVLAATGGGGNLQIFKNQAESDSADVVKLNNRLTEIESRERFPTYRAIERKATAVTELRIRVRQLSEKYIAAMVADDATRAHLREAANQRFLTSRNRGEPS
jgi:hypothetical protein